MRFATALIPAIFILASATSAMADCDRAELQALRNSGFSDDEIELHCAQTIDEILAGSPSDESGPFAGEIRSGHYTNEIGDSARIENLGSGNYRISNWHGSKDQPGKDDWYNSGSGTMQGDGRIHSVQPAVAGHPFSDIEFEGIWVVLGPEKIRLEKYRNYSKGAKDKGPWDTRTYTYEIIN